MQLGKKDNAPENLYESMPEKELYLKIRDDLLHSRTGIRLEEQLVEKNPDKFLKEINEYIRRVYRISEEKIRHFDIYINNYIFGFHVLTDVMKAKDISDIKVLAWNNVRIKQLGKREGTRISFWSAEDFRGFVEMIAVKNGVNTGKVNAIQTFTDKDSSEEFIYRFDISMGSINSTGEPYLHIRKIPKEKKTVKDLIAMQMLNGKLAEYLCRRRKEGYLVICGKNGSGKTYLLNALLDEIPDEESVLVVQENEELFSARHPDMMFQHIEVRYGLKELVINGLLTDIDHMIIGEIKGEEALYFISAALSGCTGMTTIHSVDAAGALDKLADYCKWTSDYSREDIFKMLSCVKTLVFVKDFQIKEIVENHGENGLELVYDKVKGVNRL